MCISEFRAKEVYSTESWANEIERVGETHRRPSLGIIQKGDTHERHPCAPKFEARTPEQTSRQEDGARKVAWNLARKIHKLKAEDKSTFYSPVDIEARALVSKSTEDPMFVVDSVASMHMLSKKGFKLR